MPTPFDDIDLKEALERVDDAVPAWLEESRKFFDGDHWQGGAGWIGPMPAENSMDAEVTRAQIEKAFISANKVAEVVERHMTGVIGQMPQWSLTVRRPLPEGTEPNTEEQALIGEAEAVLTQWLDERAVHEELQEAVQTLLWGERSSLRLYVPAGVREPLDPEDPDALGIPVGDEQESIYRIWLEHVEPDQAHVDEDETTKRQIGFYTYTAGEAGEEDRAELVYLDEEDRTVIRVLDNEGTIEGPFDYDFGGNLTLYEMERAPLVTEQVRDQQKLLNLAKTMLGRNVNLAGFLERVLLNAQLPGHYEEDANGNRRFVPDDFNVGAGTLNSFVGVSYEDSQGNEHLADPDIRWKDPASIENIEGTERNAYRSILEETDQLHVQIAGDSTASGESRRQARGDFKKSLQLTSNRVEKAMRWLLETVLAMTAQFMGQPGRYAELRATCECRLDTGPLTIEEMRLNMDMADRGHLSRRTAMARNGVDDPDAELERIEQERAQVAGLDEEGLRRLQETRNAIESDEEEE